MQSEDHEVKEKSSPQSQYELLSIPPPTGRISIHIIQDIFSWLSNFFWTKSLLPQITDKSRELGKGGYGSVYLATDLRCIGTRAAIKVLSKVTHVTILIIDCLLDHLGRIRDIVRGSEELQQIKNELKALMKYICYNVL